MNPFTRIFPFLLPFLSLTYADEVDTASPTEEINRQDMFERTPLMQAVRRGHADEVRALLTAGANPNIPESRNNTPLMHACQHGYTDIVRALLAAGADVNARDEQGWTALMGVCVSPKNPTTEIAELLLAAGADITPADKEYGHTALVYAAKSGKAEHVALLLKAGADATAHTGRNFCESTVLTSAVQCKASPEVLRLLIAAGADVNKGLNSRAYIDTPLGEAIWTGDADSVSTLLEAGANANPPGDSYLYKATEKDDPRLLQMLLAAGADANAPTGAGYYPLAHAARQGNADYVRMLLAAGAQVNTADINGNTALIGAARAKNPEILQILLTAGAQVNHTNKKGETALMRAAFVGNAPHVATLLAAGADKTQRNADGHTATELITHMFYSRHNVAVQYPLALEMAYTAIYGQLNDLPAAELTPLMQAVLMQDMPKVETLLTSGADVNAASALGRTALMMAADTHQADMAERLLAAGADVHARDLQGNTALILAQTEHRGFLNCLSWESSRAPRSKDAMTRCTQLLLGAGADATASNHAGQNALMIACYRRSFTADSEAAFRQLIAAGADINSRDRKGRTPLMFSLMTEDNAWMVPALTALGADINARDNAGKQAIDYTTPQSSNHKRLLTTP